jgi:hypothetical protein
VVAATGVELAAREQADERVSGELLACRTDRLLHPVHDDVVVVVVVDDDSRVDGEVEDDVWLLGAAVAEDRDAAAAAFEAPLGAPRRLGSASVAERLRVSRVLPLLLLLLIDGRHRREDVVGNDDAAVFGSDDGFRRLYRGVLLGMLGEQIGEDGSSVVEHAETRKDARVALCAVRHPPLSSSWVF